MTKVAVCISGLPRNWKKGYEYINKNIIQAYDADVFIHSWFTSSPTELDDVIDAYVPKNYMVQKDNQIPVSRDFTRGPSPRYPAYNILSFYKSIYMANLAREKHSADYDWVFRIRFDYAINRQFDLENLDSEKLYVPNDRQNAEHTIMVDQFAFSNPLNMSKYSYVCKWITEYYDTGTDMVGEHMLERHLREIGLIGDKVEYLDMQHPFSAGGGDSMRHSLIRN